MQTLHDFVLSLLTDSTSQAAYDLDPAKALHDAGLGDLTPQDVSDAIPLVLDHVPSVGEGLGGSAGVGPTEHGVDGYASFTSPVGQGSGWFHAGTDGFSFGAGAEPTFDSDVLGRGGDAVTGTVANYLGDGGNAFGDALTSGAAALSGGVDRGGDHASNAVQHGAHTLSPAITNGAEHLSDVVRDPAHLAHLPATPALPAVPDLSHLPAVPALPDLSHLPDAHLPVDLHQLPIDHLPVDLPQLPSLPSTDAVQNVLQDTLGHVPAVDHLADGITGHLPLLGH